MSLKVPLQAAMPCKSATGIVLNPNLFPQMNDSDLKNKLNAFQRSVETTTECATPAPTGVVGESGGNGSGGEQGQGSPQDNNVSPSASKLYALVQHIYAAQARVQLEVNEIKKAQAVANSAQKSLEEAANNVRVITSALQSAQEAVAAAAVRAQSAQMQLAAHDQLLFTARQKVDALSSQMVGLQVEDGVRPAKNFINFDSLLSELKQPLAQNKTPTPIPPIDKSLVEEEKNEDKSVEGDELLIYDNVNY